MLLLLSVLQPLERPTDTPAVEWNQTTIVRVTLFSSLPPFHLLLVGTPPSRPETWNRTHSHSVKNFLSPLCFISLFLFAYFFVSLPLFLSFSFLLSSIVSLSLPFPPFFLFSPSSIVVINCVEVSAPFVL